LWPLPAEKRLALSQEFGVLNDRPIAQHEIVDGTWTSIVGQRDYVRRHYADHSNWSLVIITPRSELFANRVLGIIITLLVTITTLVYLFGKERWVHDAVQAAKRIELQKLASELRFQAATDPLTGLFNRLEFDQALTNEMLRSQRYNTPLSLMVYDIDHFKRINDSYGHQTGDSVLVQLSRFVLDRIRSSDLLARWGGEEFVILLPGSDGYMAYQAAVKLRDEIDQIVFELVGSVTCSFGVAQYAHGETAEAFIARADLALYRAKIAGRNRVELTQRTAAIEPGLASVA
jgi:diguanylate cyclase (GGDEF)-like protein